MKTGNLLPLRRQERQVRKFNFFAAFAPLMKIQSRSDLQFLQADFIAEFL